MKIHKVRTGVTLTITMDANEWDKLQQAYHKYTENESMEEDDEDYLYGPVWSFIGQILTSKEYNK